MIKGRVWEVPITETIIQAVESLAKSQGYKSLKLQGKNKTRLLPSDWDEDEEYIFDDSYDSDDDDDDSDDDHDEDEYEDINDDEIEDLEKDNDNAEDDGNVIPEAEQPVEPSVAMQPIVELSLIHI